MDMAPLTMPEPPPSVPALKHNLRNPLPLSASQEAQVRDLYYKRVRSKCAAEIKEFAECAKGRTVTATWVCRAQRLAMNSCMIANANKANEDAAREEWFTNILQRRQQKEAELAAVEIRREEVIDLTRRQEEKERIQLEAQKGEPVQRKSFRYT